MHTADTQEDPAAGAPADQSQPFVSVVLPCRNEQANVLREVERIDEAFAKSSYSYEIVAVDDNSSDETRDILDHISDRFTHLRVLRRSTNPGYGAALKAGTDEAQGAVVAWTDCDLTYPNEDLPLLVQRLMTSPGCRQVVGARKGEAGTFRSLRWATKFLIRLAAQLRTRQRIPDFNSGMRIFYKADFLQVRSRLTDDFLCSPQVTAAYWSRNWRIEYSPVSYAQRSGQSKFGNIRDTWRLIRMVVSHFPADPAWRSPSSKF